VSLQRLCADSLPSFAVFHKPAAVLQGAAQQQLGVIELQRYVCPTIVPYSYMILKFTHKPDSGCFAYCREDRLPEGMVRNGNVQRDSVLTFTRAGTGRITAAANGTELTTGADALCWHAMQVWH
jgi:hypothetical protein